MKHRLSGMSAATQRCVYVLWSLIGIQPRYVVPIPLVCSGCRRLEEKLGHFPPGRQPDGLRQPAGLRSQLPLPQAPERKEEVPIWK